MASRVEGFDEKILACAKEEFLEKGYTDASIRTIAQNARSISNRCGYSFSLKAQVEEILYSELILEN